MRAASALVGGLYALAYLFGIGDLAFEPGAGWLVRTAAVSPERIFSMRAPFLFEAVAMAEAGWWVVLVSPVNVAIAALLGTLLALNVHGVIALWRAPRSCSLSGLAGAWGALPALLAGSACCAPSVLLLLGVPALGVVAAFFGYLVPLSVAALAASRLWQRRVGAPPYA
ncbi:hypothetical protein QWY84_02405 [Aquisalimonas lutea]|uniref:hypothetical protein n=1 Tax=Aquisalimonas lutea TaxID=1327750 RepID=UPI0025B573FD|nr:hypothetical protein [Aquisalimonas lutea]MDN3516451.1 hypothetical protein [Aquisalimonas lutea]